MTGWQWVYAIVLLSVLTSIAGSLIDLTKQLTVLATTHLAFYATESQREIEEAEAND